MLLTRILKESCHKILQQWKNTAWPFLFGDFLNKKLKSDINLKMTVTI